jgi:hypothetical protein
MNKILLLVLNGKGGVGKSFFATNFVQHLKDHALPHAAIDTDHENSTLKRFHPEAEFINLSQPQQSDLMFERLQKHPLVVVDCRAASTDLFLDYFSELQVFDILADLHAQLVIVSPVNHEADSIEQVRIISDGLGEKARYVVVRNHSHSDEFRLWDASQARTRVLADLNGCEIVLPKLYPWLVTAINEHEVTISAATKHTAFSILDRQRLKNWLRLFNEQLGLARGVLLPAPSEEHPTPAEGAQIQPEPAAETK